jgi:phenylacetic acid degradation operon negative regulatory protein
VTDAHEQALARIVVLGMTEEDGSLDRAELAAVAEACGITDTQIALCLARLEAEGLYEAAEGAATAQATAAGLVALGKTVERTKLAYAQDAAGRGWDRRWRLVSLDLPVGDVAQGAALRERLRTLGGAPIHESLFVSPHPWDVEVHAAAQTLGLLPSITTASTDDLVIGEVSDPTALVQRLWNLDELAQRYERFVAEYGGVPEALEEMRKRKERLTDTEFLPGALMMAMRFQECFNADPLLPPELLPRPWPGRAARDIVIRSRRLGVLARERHDRPRLFRTFDEALEALG